MIVDANIYWFDEKIFHDEAYAERFFSRSTAPLSDGRTNGCGWMMAAGRL